MSETADAPVPYRVVYSGLVRDELTKLLARATERGLGFSVRAALQEIDRRLHVYPEFGDPLIDLSLAPGELRIGTVPPLVVRYALYRDKRLVIVTTPIAPLHHSGL